MEIELKELPAMRAATVAHTGPYNQIGGAFRRLGETAAQAGLFKPGALMLGIYFDDPRTVPGEKLRSAAAVTLSPDDAVPAGLSEVSIPGGKYACVVHYGSYEGLVGAWQEFVKAFSRTHQRGPGPSLEIYRNTPGTVPETELLTELCLPVA